MKWNNRKCKLICFQTDHGEVYYVVEAHLLQIIEEEKDLHQITIEWLWATKCLKNELNMVTGLIDKGTVKVVINISSQCTAWKSWNIAFTVPAYVSENGCRLEQVKNDY